MSGTSPKDIETAERLRKAVSLRKAGATFDQIAQQCGYAGRGAAYNAVTQELRNMKGDARELHALENARLDDVLIAITPAIRSGNLDAVDRFLKIAERRAKLNGLDDYESRMAAVAERQAVVEEAQALMMARVLATTVDRLGLDDEKRSQAIEIITAELAQLEAAQPAPAAPDAAQ